jgi:hypothetical protein
VDSHSSFFILLKHARQRYVDCMNDLSSGSATGPLGSGFGAAKSKQSQPEGILQAIAFKRQTSRSINMWILENATSEMGLVAVVVDWAVAFSGGTNQICIISALRVTTLKGALLEMIFFRPF